MFKFKVIYDNCCTYDVLEEQFKANSLSEAEDIAYKGAKKYKVVNDCGNYDLFVLLDNQWVNIGWIRMLMDAEPDEVESEE